MCIGQRLPEKTSFHPVICDFTSDTIWHILDNYRPHGLGKDLLSKISYEGLHMCISQRLPENTFFGPVICVFTSDTIWHILDNYRPHGLRKDLLSKIS